MEEGAAEELLEINVTLRNLYVNAKLVSNRIVSFPTVLMRLHHSPDASTYPGFKLACFVYIIYFWKDWNKLYYLKQGFVQPYSVRFTPVSSPSELIEGSSEKVYKMIFYAKCLKDMSIVSSSCVALKYQEHLSINKNDELQVFV